MNRFSLSVGQFAENPHLALARATFIATNPTPGTGIDSDADATSRSATAGLMNIYNAKSTSAGQGNVIMPVYLLLRATQANSSATDFRIDGYLDNTDRHSSGGSSITPVPLVHSGEDSWSAPTTNANIDFGELTLSAANDEKLAFSEVVMGTIFAANDVVLLSFGDGPFGALDGTHLEGNALLVPPVWIRPGGNLSLHGYGDSQSDDPAFEFALLYVEYPSDNVAS